MKLLVTGGRSYKDYGRFNSIMAGIHARHPIHLIIEGGATGADAMARAWAMGRDIENHTYKADWNHTDHPMANVRTRRDGSDYDANAGFVRNARMLKTSQPDMVVGFAGGGGTGDMLDQAVRAGVPTLWVPDGGVRILNDEDVELSGKPVWLLKPDPSKPKIPRPMEKTPADRYESQF